MISLLGLLTLGVLIAVACGVLVRQYTTDEMHRIARLNRDLKPRVWRLRATERVRMPR